MSEETAAVGTRVRSSVATVTLGLLVASVIAVALNAAVAAIAIGAGAPATYAPLTLPVYAAFTVLGVVAGWFGWLLIVRRAKNPAAVLRVVAPVVLVLSFLPDIALLVWGFIPGSTTAGTIALMIMHVVVFAVAVPVYAFLTRSRR